MKVTAASLLLLDAFQRVHGFSSKVSPVATEKAQGPVELTNWNEQVTEPPPQGGRRYGPNWTIDPETLGPKQVDQKCGAMVWAMGNSTFVHPELRFDLPVGNWLQTRPKLGICMSGGGLRAATCALGWIRALNHKKLLTKARYLGSNSGATWTTLPLFCRQMLQKKDEKVDMEYEKFVGEYLEPEKIDFDKEVYGLVGKVLEKSDILEIHRKEENVPFTAWCDAIDRNYVEPVMDYKKGMSWRNDFWLDLNNAYLWNAPGEKDILNENSFPFPIWCSTVSDERNNQECYPVENTPLYSGVPFDPRSLNVGADFGGGYVQGVALNSNGLEDSSPIEVDSDNQSKHMNFKVFENPSPVVKVCQLTAASSQFLAAGNAMTNINLDNPFWRGLIELFLPIANRIFGIGIEGRGAINYLDPGKLKWWSPTTGGDPLDFSYVDGGMYDNLGALAVLRRGCSTLIVCDATDTNLLETKDKDLPSKMYDVAGVFGVGEPPVPKFLQKKSYAKTLNERSQVFDSKEFMMLIDEMRAKQRAGKPLVVRKKLKVIPNKFAGIYESREVDMIFCFNGEVKEFQDRAKIPKSAKIDKDFPYAETTNCDYNVGEVNYLSSICSYNLVEGLKNVNFNINQVEGGLSP